MSTVEFITVPLQVSRVATHDIYLKKHSSRSPDEENAIFVANLPRDTTLDNIKDICRSLGDSVLNAFEYQGGNHGLIQLVDEASCERFLSKARKLSKANDKSIAWTMYGARGSEAYLSKHLAKFPLESELQENVDAFMEDFAAEETRQAEEAEAAMDQVDEDGFTLVVRPKRKSMADIGVAAQQQPPAKKKKLEKEDFYRFQVRERQKQDMNDMLRRYQEDKEKVEELKRRKHFNPY